MNEAVVIKQICSMHFGFWRRKRLNNSVLRVSKPRTKWQMLNTNSSNRFGEYLSNGLKPPTRDGFGRNLCSSNGGKIREQKEGPSNKKIVRRLLSLWDGHFSGAMSVLGEISSNFLFLEA